MILSLKITQEQKEALLSFYPRGIKRFIEKTISDTADRIIIERNQFNIEEEIKLSHDRQVLNNFDIRNRKHTQATKDKISKSLKEKYQGTEHHLLEETRVSIGLGNKGKVLSQATKDNISKANKGKTRTEEQRQNISLGHKGKKYRKRIKAEEKVECIA